MYLCVYTCVYSVLFFFHKMELHCFLYRLLKSLSKKFFIAIFLPQHHWKVAAPWVNLVTNFQMFKFSVFFLFFIYINNSALNSCHRIFADVSDGFFRINPHKGEPFSQAVCVFLRLPTLNHCIN